MSAGIPVLCAMDLAGDAPKLIKELNCGVNILPGDYNKLAKSAIHLVDNEFERAKLGGNGLNYIKNNLRRSLENRVVNRIESRIYRNLRVVQNLAIKKSVANLEGFSRNRMDFK